MIIQYELKRISMGVIMSDPQTVTGRDVTLSFLLPPNKTVKDGEEYIAVITDQSGKEHKLRISNMQCVLPDRLIKSQTLNLTVLQIEGGAITKQWRCQPFRLVLLDDMLKLTCEAGVDYAALQGLYAGLVDRVDCAVEQKQQEINMLKQELDRHAETLVGLKKSIAALSTLSDNQKILQENIKHLNATVESLK